MSAVDLCGFEIASMPPPPPPLREWETVVDVRLSPPAARDPPPPPPPPLLLLPRSLSRLRLRSGCLLDVPEKDLRAQASRAASAAASSASLRANSRAASSAAFRAALRVRRLESGGSLAAMWTAPRGSSELERRDEEETRVAGERDPGWGAQGDTGGGYNSGIVVFAVVSVVAMGGRKDGSFNMNIEKIN